MPLYSYLKRMSDFTRIYKKIAKMLTTTRKIYIPFNRVKVFNFCFSSNGVLDSSQILTFFKDRMKYACFKLTIKGIFANNAI